MSRYSVDLIVTGKPRAFSRLGLSHYLRLGFLPAPLSVYANEFVTNDFHCAFHDDFDPHTGRFTRDLRQFVGTRRRDSTASFDNAAAIAEVRTTLLETTARVTEGYDHIFLMVSGGKDSVAIAWALRELGRPVTLIHCTNRGREDESPDVARVAEMLGHEYLFLPDDIESVDAYFTQNAHKLPIPMADPAFFAYLRAVQEITGILDASGAKKVVLLDGMGNDAYMGHIPPKREKRLLRLPRLPILSENLISLSYGYGVTHYALETLFKRRPERHFSGAFFATDIGPIAVQMPEIFARFGAHPEERRALLRGGVLDVDAGMRKGVLAATLDGRIDVSFPFFDPQWVRLFETFPESAMFDYPASFNKKILRGLLKQSGIVSDHVFSRKGSFRFNLDGLPALYAPSPELVDSLAVLGVGPRALTRLAKSSRDSFVAAQKLGVLYILDRFLQVHGFPTQFADPVPNPITYTA